MRAITEALKDGAWKGRACFVVGSGPSLRGFDRSILASQLSIGTNEEYRWGPSVALCQDVRWLRKYHEEETYKACPSLKVYFKAHPDRQEGFEPGDHVHQVASTLSRNDRPWGVALSGGLIDLANCGFAALNLACILGADPIYLLGFDCRPDERGRVHGHDHYPPEWEMSPDSDRFGVWAREIARYTGEIKSEVVNLCPHSRIMCFPCENPVHAFLSMVDGNGEPLWPSSRVFDAWRGTSFMGPNA